MKGLRLLPEFSNHDHGIIVTRHNTIPPSKASIFLESEPCSILKLAGARQYNGNARLCNAELLWELFLLQNGWLYPSKWFNRADLFLAPWLSRNLKYFYYPLLRCWSITRLNPTLHPFQHWIWSTGLKFVMCDSRHWPGENQTFLFPSFSH